LKFIVGIGNPEKQYDKTRHNVGFRVLDALCAKHSGVWRSKKKSRSQVCSLEPGILIKPETYVNNTGDAVKVMQQKYGAAPSDFLFVCDDVNLVLGKIRLRDSGSAGGHHGLESVIGAFGSEDFPRLRVGVGNESMPQGDLTGFVLGRFEPGEQGRLNTTLEKAVSVCSVWLEQGFEPALNELSKVQSIKGSEQ
jgi:PTH1 family peptidyl-tRNA hydrolase